MAATTTCSLAVFVCLMGGFKEERMGSETWGIDEIIVISSNKREKMMYHVGILEYKQT